MARPSRDGDSLCVRASFRHRPLGSILMFPHRGVHHVQGADPGGTVGVAVDGRGARVVEAGTSGHLFRILKGHLGNGSDRYRPVVGTAHKCTPGGLTLEAPEGGSRTWLGVAQAESQFVEPDQGSSFFSRQRHSLRRAVVPVLARRR